MAIEVPEGKSYAVRSSNKNWQGYALGEALGDTAGRNLPQHSQTGGTKKMREYAVVYEKGPVSWGAYLPDLPGLAATADTLEEVKELIREGLELHLESMLEDGDSIPEAASQVGTLKTDIVEAWKPQLAKTA